MFDALVDRLILEKAEAADNPRSCENMMAQQGRLTPCFQDCPCALRDRVISDAEHIAALENAIRAADRHVASGHYKMAQNITRATLAIIDKRRT